ncbi:MAG: HAD-IIIC family phosphatase [Candidatus Solibacter sp.]|nr:HAD-IIIC family phosphatase [Candidatus Solibacter sp.]
METGEFRQEVDLAIAAGDPRGAARMLAWAWERDPGSALAGFVVSRYGRIAGHLGLLKQRWAILRSFTVEPVVPVLKAGAYAAGVALETHLGEFNAYAQEILDPASALYRFQPDVAVLAVLTRDVAPGLWRGESAADDVLGRFGEWIGSFRKYSKAALIVHSLEVPAVPCAGILDAQREDNRAEAIQRINRGLRALAGEHRGVYTLDYDALVARHGRQSWGDARKWLTVRLPVASANLPHLAAEWLRFLHPLAGKVAKCVAVDLDHTLWGGVIGEDGLNGICLGAEYPGAAFQELQRALLDLKRRGILLAVCSKNNPADAMEALSGHPGMVLQPGDFAAMRINWSDKAGNLREIAAELNVGLDTIAFLDDSPVERQQVREQAPEAIVIHLPEDPMGYAQAVRDCPWFERLTLSEEDHQRGEYYAAQRERVELGRSVTSREDFYRALEQTAEIAPVTAQTLARVSQLTQKTNQFNLTTRRYTEQQIAEMAACPSCRVWSLRVKDKYADNGLVGVAIVKLDGDACEIDSFLLSCRVIGRTVETALLAHLAADARQQGAKVLQGWFFATRKNAPAQEFYRDHGFEMAEQRESGILWRLDLGEKEIRSPEWIKQTIAADERR